ncbi:hypothetical protein KA119_02835 [Candidatus Gracilibacteria bacterium]|nr:hypothetical protein [Candidatus Gracilibacteria bacterium]
MQKELHQFLERANSIYGLFLDATIGFYEWRQNLITQEENIQKQTSSTENDFNSMPYLYVVKQNDGTIKQLSCWTTLGELKQRLNKKGENHFQIANLSLVMIYSYWEYFRNKIKKSKKKTINSDLMGDIRHLRRSIIHNKGLALKEVSSLKILPNFNEGTKIEIDEVYFEQIMILLRNEIKSVNTG